MGARHGSLDRMLCTSSGVGTEGSAASAYLSSILLNGGSVGSIGAPDRLADLSITTKNI